MTWPSRRTTRKVLLVLTGLTLSLAAGCKSDSPAAPGATSGGLKTDVGVTADTIKLGVLTDRTGAFATAGKAVEQGRTLYWDKKRKVCDREVKFVTKNHGYNAQNATTAYAEIKNDVLALDELLGAPMIAGLLKDLEADGMLTMAVSFSSNLLANKYVVLTGTTYDIEMINAVDYLVKNKGLVKGDKIGHIFQEGDYGENAAAGSKVAAKEAGLELVEQKIKATDADLTAQVTALKTAGVKAVLLTTTAAQTGSAVNQGLDVPFVASNPAFSPTLLTGAAKAALEKRLLVVTSVAPFSSTAAGPTQVRDAFKAKYPDQPKTGFMVYGYAQGEIMAQVLEAACKQGDMTRAGLLKAFQSLKKVDTDGLVATLDYSRPGGIPARETFVLKPDAAAEGGLSVVQELTASPLALKFKS